MSAGTSSIQTFKFFERIALLASEWAAWLPVRLTWLKQMLENKETKAFTSVSDDHVEPKKGHYSRGLCRLSQNLLPK